MRLFHTITVILVVIAASSITAIAQEPDEQVEETVLEEVQVKGKQIKGAHVDNVLPVTRVDMKATSRSALNDRDDR